MPGGPRLLVFAKAPRPGRVKTRLAGVLGPEGAARLHAALVERTLSLATALPWPVELWCHPDASHPLFARWAARGVPLRVQEGAGLGERMAAALEQALARGGPALLLGCDCPGLQEEDLRQALRCLEEREAVLGPAEDGGYWLIGLRAMDRRLFQGLAWGGPRVLAATLARLASLGWRCALLPPRPDLDRPADLDAFLARPPAWLPPDLARELRARRAKAPG